MQECNSGQVTYSGLIDSSQNYDGGPNDGKVGNDYVFVVRAIDAEGNVVHWNDASRRSFRVDTTPPQLRLPADITQKATNSSGAVVNFTASANDERDGSIPVNCSKNSGDTFLLGTTTVNCSATDAADNQASGSFDVTVSYDFGGFFIPVDNPEVATNKAKAGSAIPVKFSLGGDMGLDIFVDGYPKSQQIPNPQVTVGGIEQTVTAGSSGHSYDPTTGVYTYVWKAEKAWAGQDRQLVVQFNDGTTVKRANFQFTK